MSRRIAGFVLIGLIAVAGCKSGSSNPDAAGPTTSTGPATSSEPLQGTVELHGRDASVVSIDGQEGSECGTPRVLHLPTGGSTEGIYDSWKEGADVIVRDEHGEIIGKDMLTSGIATAVDGNTVTTCVFTFSVDVPTDAKSYQVTVGRAAPRSFRRADVEREGWRVSLEGSA